MSEEKILEPVELEYDLDNADDKAMYDSLLNEQGDIEVAGLCFTPSRIVEELDPTAYRCGFNDYVDSLPARFQCPICDKIHEDDTSAKWCCQTEPEESEE